MDDLELLKAYADHRDQDAFSQLVGRHGGWLCSAARRQLGDGHLAEDVAQAVFMLLARRGKGLRRHTYLSGWLFRALGYCVRRAMRDRARLEKREREAATMRPETTEPNSNWDEIAPNLEQAVASLSGRDRDAVLLRFYEQRPLAEVGRLLGISEDAARMRVDRAVEKLRGMLEKQGVTGTSAGLSAVLVGNVVQQAPVWLVGEVVKAVGSGGSAVAGGIAEGAMKMMVLAKVKVAAMVAGGFIMIMLGLGIALQAGSTRPTAEQAPPVAAKLPAIRAGQTVEVLAGAPKLEEVLLGMRTQEDAVRNVAIEDFETAVFRRKVDVETWERSPEGSRGNAWYAGWPAGKLRFDFASHVLRWEAAAVQQPGAPKAYADTRWDISFDGETSMEIRHASGFPGKLQPNQFAMVSAGRHPSLDTVNSAQPTTVAALALWYQRRHKGERLSEELARAVRDGTVLTVSRELVDGVELVRLTAPSGGSLWLDPQKAYALVRMHSEFKDHERLIAYRREAVTEFTQAAPGLWLPLAGFAEDKDPDGSLVRLEYWARRVVANDPKFDDSVFRPAIPKGYQIIDTRTDPAYRGSQQQHEFEAGKSGGLAPEQLARGKEMQAAVYVCLLYVNEHRRRWPGSLEEAYEYIGRKREVSDQWEYRRPEGSNGEVAVLFEKVPAYVEGELVVFADGYVELIRDRRRLSDLRGERR